MRTPDGHWCPVRRGFHHGPRAECLCSRIPGARLTVAHQPYERRIWLRVAAAAALAALTIAAAPHIHP